MEANIMAKLNTVSNVTITKVSPGSINVANSVAFTGADSNVAKANQDAFASLLGSTDGVTSIYGTTFGAVTVSQVTQTTSPNPSKFLLSLVLRLMQFSSPGTVQSQMQDLSSHMYHMHACGLCRCLPERAEHFR